METLVMSGAARGIGKEALRRIRADRPDLTVVVLARPGADLSWARAAGGGGLHVVDVDLGSLSVTRSAAETGSYVDQDRPDRSSAESYDPQREHDLVAFLDALAQEVGAPQR